MSLNDILYEIGSSEVQSHGAWYYEISVASFNLIIANYNKFIFTVWITDKFLKLDGNNQWLSQLNYAEQVFDFSLNHWLLT